MRSARMRSKTRLIALLMMLVWMLSSTVVNVSAVDGMLPNEENVSDLTDTVTIAEVGEMEDEEEDEEADVEEDVAEEDEETDVEEDEEGENENNEISALTLRPLTSWNISLQRRDWQGSPTWTANCNDNAGVARGTFPAGTLEPTLLDGELVTTYGQIFNFFFNAINNAISNPDIYNNSITAPANLGDRRVALRVFHGSPVPYPPNPEALGQRYHVDMVDGSSTVFPRERWGHAHFQYAFVQWLHFDANISFDEAYVPGQYVRPEWNRMVIMGNFYDRMFVSVPAAANSPAPNHFPYSPRYYETLRNYFFPVSPICPPSTVAGMNPRNGHRGIANVTGQISHPKGYIFGGWFDTREQANNLGSQDGRVRERTENVTTALNRTIYARWYPRPTILKTVNPRTLTAVQVEAEATLTYTITVNVGDLPPEMINLEVIDNLPTYLTFVPNSLTSNIGFSGITNNSDGNNLRFTIAGLSAAPPNGMIRFTFQTNVATDTPAGTIGNTAILLGPPSSDGGERGELDRDEAEVTINPPIVIPPCDCPPCPPCDCYPCDCFPCDCYPCDCYPCDCYPCDCYPCDCYPCDCYPCVCYPCDCECEPCICVCDGSSCVCVCEPCECECRVCACTNGGGTGNNNNKNNSVGGGGSSSPVTGDQISNSIIVYFVLLAFSTFLGGEAIKRRKKRIK